MRAVEIILKAGGFPVLAHPLLYHMSQARLEKLFEDPTLLRTPVVRNGRQATVGFCPEVWEGWE